jgi:7-cyano-7-deazaguanine synthase
LPSVTVGRLGQSEGGPTIREGHGLVLASGGIDSSTLLALARVEGLPPSALFVDYGQAASAAEAVAVTAICSQLGVPLYVVRCGGMSFGEGEIRGRNAFLLQTALMRLPWPSGTVLIGVHAGTGYRDCSPEFVELMQQSFDFHTGGAISVAAPFVDWTKGEIYQLALRLGVPLRRTYSCEAGSVACNSCRSCLDRQALGLES